MKTKFIYIMCLALIVSATACSVTPKYEKPSAKIPTAWSDLTQIDTVAVARDWWKGFGSSELNVLIDKALANNNELLAGVYKVEQSRATVKSAGAGVLPEVNGSAGTSNRRTNPVTSGSVSTNSLQAGVSISYEVDLFGRNRATIDAAKAQLAGKEYDLEALKLVVMAEVATNYFSLINQREKLVIAEEILKNEKEILKIIEARTAAGADSDIKMFEQKKTVNESEANLASITKGISVTENALAVLIGEAPKHIKFQAKSLADLKLPKIKADTPSRILDKRPDVCAAESALFEANANIGIARAAYFPSFSLTSGLDISSSGIGDQSATALSLVSSLAVPLFKGWSIEAGVEQATAREKELVETYRKTILEALQEVEDSMTAVRISNQREVSLLISRNQANKTYDLYSKKYESGNIDYQTFLTAKNSKLSTDNSYIDIRYESFEAAVTLFKALGGGWK